MAGIAKTTAKTGGSVMVPGEILPVEEFMIRVGVTRYGLAAMRNRGLKVRKDGNRSVVRYDDYDSYTKNLPTA